MITVTITNSANVTRAYTEEASNFSWTTRNNEGTAFSASVPMLSASITLSAVDSFLKALDRDATVVVTGTGTGLSLPLSIIEVTPLVRKGKTEISCSGNFFQQTNDVWGTLTIPAGTWQETQEKYGLGAVELHESNPEFSASVSKKEDLIMGAAWAFPDRHNVSLTPFTTGDSNFNSSGVGIFKNIKETDSVDTYAPVYRVLAEDIVDYEIEAAEPPVTHLQTSALGDLEPTPQLPKEIVPKYSGTAGSVDIRDNVRSFYISDNKLGAVYVAKEDSGGNMISQQLKWTDGFVTDLGISDKIKVIGIFPDSYVILNPSASTQVLVKLRSDNSVVRTLFLLANGDPLWDGPAIGLVPSRNTSSVVLAGVRYNVLWFANSLAMSGNTTLYGIVQTPTTYKTIIQGGASLTGIFGGDVVVSSPNGDAIEAVYADTSGARRGVLIDATSIDSTSLISPTIKTLPNLSTISGTTLLQPLDFIGTVSSPTSSNPHYMTWICIVAGSGLTTVLEYFTESASSIIYSSSSWSAAYWVIDGTGYKPSYSTTPMLIHHSDKTWSLIQPFPSPTFTSKVLQSGSITQWIGTSSHFVSIYRGAVLALGYMGSNTWNVYLQISSVPYVSRGQGSLATPQQIAEGNTNVVQLPFKVGLIPKSIVDALDSDKGRVELNLAQFRVRNNTNSSWVARSVQGLNVMALGSYVKVWLDPEDSSDVITVKVTGFSLTYDGIVVARVSGIIV